MRQKLPLVWTVGHTTSPERAPEQFFAATVPGAVQLDYARAHGWPEPAEDPDVTKYRWMEDVHWCYRTTLPPLTREFGAHVYLVLKGVDYKFDIRLNGSRFDGGIGMYTSFEMPLGDDFLAGGQIEIWVYPAPKSCNSGDRNEANASIKPAVSYGWDFHPRLIPLGMWQDAYVEVRPAAYLRQFECKYELSDDLKSATLFFDTGVSGEQTDHMLQFVLLDPDGQEVLSYDMECAPESDGYGLQTTFESPTLWWPNGQGAPVLYTAVCRLLDVSGAEVDRSSHRIGFRRVRLVMHEAQWDEPEIQVFPKGRHSSPITLEVNGRRVFGKGANWVTPDIFPGRVTEQDYRAQLSLAHAHHFNLLRCWGGANVQKEAFFDLCDELGLMVWQEFTLACNRYEGTPDYLAVLDEASRSIIKQLRTHPSVVIWCGGNELFNNWSKMTDQDLALRLLNRNTYDMDPLRPFLMTSPMQGMAHGGYFFRRDDGAEVYQYFAASRNTAYTEFGVPGSASAELLRKIIPEGELWPPRPGTQWQTRHAFGSWQQNSWLDLHTINHYFGQPDTLEQMVEGSQWLQAEGYKAIFEEARRQKPVCAMALNWVFNEPWPSAANNSLINWPAQPKPALAAVGESCRDQLSSARIPKFSWRAGEAFSAELWLLNDGPAIPPSEVIATIELGDRLLHALTWAHTGAADNCNVQGPSLRIVLPDVPANRLTLRLQAGALSSSYVLHYTPGLQTGQRAIRMGDV
jgi:beta-mannosidase